MGMSSCQLHVLLDVHALNLQDVLGSERENLIEWCIIEEVAHRSYTFLLLPSFSHDIFKEIFFTRRPTKNLYVCKRVVSISPYLHVMWVPPLLHCKKEGAAIINTDLRNHVLSLPVTWKWLILSVYMYADTRDPMVILTGYHQPQYTVQQWLDSVT